MDIIPLVNNLEILEIFKDYYGTDARNLDRA